MKSFFNFGHFNRSALTALLAWSCAMGGLLAWDIQTVRKHTNELAINDARSNFNKDQVFRLWATRHGGVYVPVDQRTQPNPGLAHVPERDIETPSGITLTLMNPAYMMRQFVSEFDELFGIKGRITSLNLISELNAPDEWEIKALHRFELGEEEIFEFTSIGDVPYLRLMRPMMTGEGCLKCHAIQGYSEGDVRGGVGVSINMEPYLANMYDVIRFRTGIYTSLWLVGIAVVLVIFTLLKRRFDEQERASAQLRHQQEITQAAFNDLQRLSEVMAHHFQEPTRRLASFSARLLQSTSYVTDRDSRLSLQFIDEQSRRLADLVRAAQQYLALNHVNDIRMVEKEQAGAATSDDILNEVVVESGADAVAAEIKVSRPLPQVVLAPKYLRQLFLVLIENSVRYRHPERPLRIEVDAVVDSDRACFRFADNGSGISEEYREQVFDLFARLVPNHMPGTGIGLALARKIVYRCGGRITIEDGLGGGVCVVFDLPVKGKRLWIQKI